MKRTLLLAIALFLIGHVSAQNPDYLCFQAVDVYSTVKLKVSGIGTYYFGDTAIIVSHPANGYHSTGWSDGSTSDSIIFVVTDNRSLTAYFEKNKYMVIGEASHAGGGTVSGSVSCLYGDTVTLTATPNPYHIFTGWSNGDTSNVISICVTSDTVLTAFFTLDPRVRYVNISVNDSRMGFVTGDAFCYSQDTVKLTAVAKCGYRFVNWSSGDTSAVISVCVDRDTTFIANFAFNNPCIELDGLNFMAVDGPATVQLTNNRGASISLVYSLDSCATWNPYTINQVIQLAENDKVYFRASSTNSSMYGYRFVMTGNVAGNGNIMSLLDASLTQDYVPASAFEYLFQNCTSLTTPPALPATTLGDYCYAWMFAGCSSLMVAPELPATELTSNCYRDMFNSCSSLKYPPELPAMKLGYNCYGAMFVYCTSLRYAPDLPATALTDVCYGSMFRGCASLTSIPDLPADSLTNRCYEYMFQYCGSLHVDTIPHGRLWKIPDNAVSASSWNLSMFNGTGGSFTDNPVIGTTYYVSSDTRLHVLTSSNDGAMGTVTRGGYYDYGDTVTLSATPNPYHIFTGWSNGDTSQVIMLSVTSDTVLTAYFSLNPRARYVSVLVNDTNLGKVMGGGYCYYQDTVTLTAVPNKYSKFKGWSNGDSSEIITFCVVSDTMMIAAFEFDTACFVADILHFTAVDGPATVRLINNWGAAISLVYSLDSCVTWNPYTINQIIQLAENEKVYFRASSTNSSMYGYQFVMTGKLAGNGNIMSLLDASLAQDYVPASAFECLFQNCTSLLTPPSFPATSLAWHCYGSVFRNCSSLTTAPALPATTLEYCCYGSMFENCYSLAQAPILPATTLATECYQYMFAGCYSLIQAPELPVTTMAPKCYYYMFSRCSSLTRLPELPATVLADNCYDNMFRGCTSLMIDTLPPGTQWQIPSNAVSASYWNSDMFVGTGGSFTGDPEIGRTYYISSDTRLVIANSSDSTMGQVSGSGNYYVGDTVTLSATPNPYHIFTGWSNGDTSQVIMLCVTSDTVLTAYFALDPRVRFVTSTVNDSTLGYVIGGGRCLCQDTVTLTAVSSRCSRFVGWSNGETTETISICVVSDTTLMAYFELDSAYIDSNVLHFVAVGGPASIKLEQMGSPLPVSLLYSVDSCATWNTYTINQEIQLSSGEKVFFKAATRNATFSNDVNNYYRFTMTDGISAEGNIMSLLDANLCEDSVPQYAFCKLFESCHSLIKTPYLPATRLSEGCYMLMFVHCTSLMETPLLPAETVPDYGYRSMFELCRSITHISTISAKTLGYESCAFMFANCRSLIKAPVLSFTTLGDYCCFRMFINCVSLTNIPELPAMTLNTGCYMRMFEDCSSLFVNTAPPGTAWQIPAGAFTWTNCTSDMFEGTSGTFTGNPWVGRTYYIFSDYMSVTAISDNQMMGEVSGSGRYCQGDTVTLTATPNYGCHFAGWSNGCSTESIQFCVLCDTVLVAYFEPDSNAVFVNGVANSLWLGHVEGGGYYYVGDTATLSAHPSPVSVFSHWSNGDTSKVISVNVICDTTLTACFVVDTTSVGSHLPLNFVAVSENASVMLDGEYCENSVDLQYSLDGCVTWLQYSVGQRIDLSHLDRVFFKATTTNNTLYGCNFVMTGVVAGDGNIMSLLDATMLQDSVPDNAFSFLFSGCSSLLSPPALPAMTLGEYCYSWMFAGCTSLLASPELPATVMKNNCYRDMFNSCVSMVYASELPAMTLDYNCYGAMFAYCTSLRKTPDLPAINLTDICYGSMFVGCSSLTTIPDLPATSLAYGCYEYMFVGCTSLRISEYGPGKEWMVPAEATYADRWNDEMFVCTSGDFTADPQIGVIYFIASDTTSAVDNVVDEQVRIVVSPNPVRVSQTAFVNVPHGSLFVDVYSANGVLVKRIDVTSPVVAVNGLNSAGVYYVRVTKTDGTTVTVKLIVQ